MGQEYLLFKPEKNQRFDLSKGEWSRIFDMYTQFKIHELKESLESFYSELLAKIAPKFDKTTTIWYFYRLAKAIFKWCGHDTIEFYDEDSFVDRFVTPSTTFELDKLYPYTGTRLDVKVPVSVSYPPKLLTGEKDKTVDKVEPVPELSEKGIPFSELLKEMPDIRNELHSTSVTCTHCNQSFELIKALFVSNPWEEKEGLLCPHCSEFIPWDLKGLLYDTPIRIPKDLHLLRLLCGEMGIMFFTEMDDDYGWIESKYHVKPELHFSFSAWANLPYHAIIAMIEPLIKEDLKVRKIQLLLGLYVGDDNKLMYAVKKLNSEEEK